GEFGYENLNVANQRRDPGSLLNWMERALHTLRECPEFGVGTCQPIDSGAPSVLALLHSAPGGVMLAVTNLGDVPCAVDLGEQPGQEGEPVEVFANRAYEPAKSDLGNIELDAYGYRWIRLRETPGR
ncbi:MAG: alpha-glucosidase C-terminal domain-containing protein, partial [Actinomycetota bacterium]|nr:alpha-glucosidase C-terminal domain-containing protein [Actinomycetota bacterium]